MTIVQKISGTSGCFKYKDYRLKRKLTLLQFVREKRRAIMHKIKKSKILSIMFSTSRFCFLCASGATIFFLTLNMLRI